MASCLVAAAAACLFTEFVGYWLHILLHSRRIEFLSRNHMIHHLIVYAPDKPQRPSHDYLLSTYGRASVLGIGMEWILPAAVILAVEVGAMTALGVGALPQAVFVAAGLAWGWLMFGYMHDAMHLKGFWMEGGGAVGRWFLRARRYHDIHHMDLDDEGFMPYNFGICFFAFDALFGTLRTRHERFNRAGLEASRRAYAYIGPMA
jgi:sterol desaturase/sphingolipid hydroxylase (fatty acid hydroxylase superfamily)